MFVRKVLIAATLAAGAVSASAQIAYISSASGYMLHSSGGGAVTADWRGQAPIEGFGGYGQIRMGGQCLSGKAGNQQLRWEGCNGGERGQRWKLEGGRLNNELGYCADVEGARGGAGVRVMAWSCNGQGNQRWRAHQSQSAASIAGKIRDPKAAQAVLERARVARPGETVISASGLVAAGGGNIQTGLPGANLVAAGGGTLVAAGGGN
jgi:hypothetical protein